MRYLLVIVVDVFGVDNGVYVMERDCVSVYVAFGEGFASDVLASNVDNLARYEALASWREDTHVVAGLNSIGGHGCDDCVYFLQRPACRTRIVPCL